MVPMEGNEANTNKRMISKRDTHIGIKLLSVPKVFEEDMDGSDPPDLFMLFLLHVRHLVLLQIQIPQMGQEAARKRYRNVLRMH